MSRKTKGFRFAVGSEQDNRSNTWKVVVNKNDMYLLSKGFGSDFKISFHESGQCQCSLTDSYVKRTGISNKNRHFEKWNLPIDLISKL